MTFEVVVHDAYYFDFKPISCYAWKQFPQEVHQNNFVKHVESNSIPLHFPENRITPVLDML